MLLTMCHLQRLPRIGIVPELAGNKVVFDEFQHLARVADKFETVGAVPCVANCCSALLAA